MTPRTTAPPLRRLLAAAGATLLIVLGLAPAASAAPAPPFATDADTTITFASTEVVGGDLTKLVGQWTLPDNPANPAGFVVDLPEGLRGVTTNFLMVEPGTSTRMGQCAVTSTQLVCEVDASYVADHPRGLHGAFSFWVRVTDKVTEDTTKTWDIDGTVTTVTVTPPASNPCTQNCDQGPRGAFKWGSYALSSPNPTIRWTVVVQAPADGMAGGQAVRVTDAIGPGQQLDDAYLVGTNQKVRNADGKEEWTNWQALPAAVSSDFTTVEFTSEAGWVYEVKFVAKVLDPTPLNGTEYRNDVTIVLAGEEVVVEPAYAYAWGGSATGIGENVGVFSISKAIEGVEGLTDQVFTGTYAVTEPDGSTTHEGTWSTSAGASAPWTSPEFPRGSTVTITEDAPSGPEAVEWTSTLPTEPIELAGGTITPITVTNTGTLRTGQFSVHKVLAGSGTGAVPGDAVFTVDWSYPAGPGYAAGSGSLEVPADGTPAVSPAVPAGAVVSLSERPATAVPGLVWTPGVFSQDEVTVVAGGTAEVTLTNAADLATGSFSVTKVVEGSGADLAPSSFEVAWSYPAGPGYAAASGTLTVPGDGTVVESPALPAGAVATLTETTPADVPGATWSPGVFSADKVTVIADEVVPVTLTNTLTTNPPTTPPPTTEPPTTTPPTTTPPTTTTPPELPETGVSGPAPVLGLAGGLVLLGLAALAIRRTRVTGR